jgi:hypothetical protein
VDSTLADAVTARYYAVNGHHEMTADDDRYVSSWYVTLEDLAASASLGVDEIRRLMLANRLPLPSYIHSDGTQMVPPDLLSLAKRAGGFEELPAWFARQWDSPQDAVREWDAYLSGKYVCLRAATPENMRRKDELVDAITRELAHADPASADWLAGLHQLVDELDEIEPLFAPYDRLRFGGPVSRDRLITAVRQNYPLGSRAR